MVVLIASVCTKSGKPLLSRQFVDISRVRVEGLLAAFPKLMNSEKEHTFIETESVRYVYQPMESLYMLVVTNKSSNIMEDLETLHLLAKLVPDYCGTLDERSIQEHTFDIIFAFDEVIAAGYKEKVTLLQIKTFTEMDSHEERIHEILEDNKRKEAQRLAREKQKAIERERRELGFTPGAGMGSMGGMGNTGYGGGMGGGMGGMGGSGSSRSSSEPFIQKSSASTSKSSPSTSKAPPKSGMKLGQGAKADVLKQLEAAGELVEDSRPTSSQLSSSASSVGAGASTAVSTEGIHIIAEEKITCISDQDGGLDTFEVKGDLSFRIADASRARFIVHLAGADEKAFQFRTHPNINKPQFSKEKILALKDTSRAFPAGPDMEPLGVLKWRHVASDESAVPLTVSCWPSPSSDVTTVNMEFELQRQEFELQNVVIEIPIPGTNSPVVDQAEGTYQYDHKAHILRWSHPIINGDNATGSMEFKLPHHVDASQLFPVSVSFTSPNTFCPIEIAKVISLDTNQPVKFSQESRLVAETYQIVHT